VSIGFGLGNVDLVQIEWKFSKLRFLKAVLSVFFVDLSSQFKNANAL